MKSLPAPPRRRWRGLALAGLATAAGLLTSCREDADGTYAYRASTLMLRFSDDLPEADRAAVRARVGATGSRRYPAVPGLERLDLAGDVPAAMAALGAHPGVRYAVPDYLVTPCVTPDDPGFPGLWGMQRIHAPLAWDRTTGDADFVVALLDEGVDVSHPDLAGNIWVNPDEIPDNGVDDDGNGYVDDVHGWDFFHDDASVYDGVDDDHGTHVAGTLAGVGDNAQGVAGVNWRARIMVLKFLGPAGGYTSDAIAALQYATRKGVRVSNNSWGGGGFSQPLYDAIAASQAVGHVFVAAAGNSGQQLSEAGARHYPSSYALPNIVAVAAIDSEDRLASFSNHGYDQVDLAAPGVSILSTLPENRYGYYSGTSMATPHVAGVAALLLGHEPGLSGPQAIDRLLGTVDVVDGLAERVFTAGVVDAAAAVAPPDAAPRVTVLAPAGGVGALKGSAVAFSASAADAEDGSLAAGLVWTSDLDGVIGAGAGFQATSLSVGTHVVTAAVTDSGGNTGLALFELTVTDPALEGAFNGRSPG